MDGARYLKERVTITPLFAHNCECVRNNCVCARNSGYQYQCRRICISPQRSSLPRCICPFCTDIHTCSVVNCRPSDPPEWAKNALMEVSAEGE